ncbi:MAG: hypothetical protein M5U26_00355 [Planctomycetota bacterium]|nr:hypothetical protein [Planctomycetota bacterium]
MARRPARAEPAYDDELEEDEEEILRELQEEESEEESEYVACPVCNGRNRSCRYCEGHGDVHPDDVGPILEARREDKTKKLFLGIGGALFLGAAVAVFMIVSKGGGSGDTSGGGSSAENGKGETATPGAAKTKGPATPSTRDESVAAELVEMRLDLKFKQYQKALERAQATLPKAQDPNQRRNIEMVIEQARKGLGQ